MPSQDAAGVFLGLGGIAVVEIPIADAVCHGVERQFDFLIGVAGWRLGRQRVGFAHSALKEVHQIEIELCMRLLIGHVRRNGFERLGRFGSSPGAATGQMPGCERSGCIGGPGKLSWGEFFDLVGLQFTDQSCDLVFLRSEKAESSAVCGSLLFCFLFHPSP